MFHLKGALKMELLYQKGYKIEYYKGSGGHSRTTVGLENTSNIATHTTIRTTDDLCAHHNIKSQMI